MTCVTTIHQPYYLPWLGYLDKVASADIFVVLDTVQFKKSNFINRVKIRTHSGTCWLSIPVKQFSHNTRIKDIEISYDHAWIRKHESLLRENYRKSPFYDHYVDPTMEILKREYTSLSTLNIEMLRYLFKCFEIKTEIMIASNLSLPEVKGGTEVNLEVAKAVGAKEYISGPFGKEYLDLNVFKKSGINVRFHNFKHPVYNQLFQPFEPALSSVDLLFNYGPKAKNILFSQSH